MITLNLLCYHKEFSQPVFGLLPPPASDEGLGPLGPPAVVLHRPVHLVLGQHGQIVPGMKAVRLLLRYQVVPYL